MISGCPKSFLPNHPRMGQPSPGPFTQFYCGFLVWVGLSRRSLLPLPNSLFYLLISWLCPTMPNLSLVFPSDLEDSLPGSALPQFEPQPGFALRHQYFSIFSCPAQIFTLHWVCWGCYVGDFFCPMDLHCFVDFTAKQLLKGGQSPPDWFPPLR